MSLPLGNCLLSCTSLRAMATWLTIAEKWSSPKVVPIAITTNAIDKLEVPLTLNAIHYKTMDHLRVRVMIQRIALSATLWRILLGMFGMPNCPSRPNV